MTRGAPVLIGIGMAVAACASEARQAREIVWVGQIGPEAVEGKVRVVGNDPFSYAVVQPLDEEGRIVTGAFKSELRRLAGAEVRVTGRLIQGELPDTTLEASSYEVLSVDGDRPLLGTLELDADGFFLARSGVVVRRVGFVSESLAQRVGSLVWIVLDELGGVARYGILREPK